MICKYQLTTSEELPIHHYISTHPERTNPVNHLLSLTDVILLPDNDDHVILVMPLLHRTNWPLFWNVAEALHCAKQLVEVRPLFS